VIINLSRCVAPQTQPKLQHEACTNSTEKPSAKTGWVKVPY